MIGIMLGFSACSSSDDSGPDPTPTPVTPGTSGTAVDPTTMQMSALSGFVFDDQGNALSGVTVTSGTESATTGSDGGIVLNSVNSVKGRSLVTFSCNGYVDVGRSAKTVSGDVREVVMVNSYTEGRTATAYGPVNTATSVSAGGMKVSISADG